MHHQPQPQQSSVGYDEVAVMDHGDGGDGGPGATGGGTTGLKHTRSLSDGGATPHKLPAARLAEAARHTSKDDSAITICTRDSCSGSMTTSTTPALPITPHQSGFSIRGLPVPLLPQASTPPAQPPSNSSFIRPTPLSPKLDHSVMYSSPTNILPRRSRGLDFSRAATSLHHTTLAEQSSPDSSPTAGGRATSIPSRRSGDFGAPEQTSTSLWSVMGNHDRHHMSNFSNSAAIPMSHSSTSSDEDDMMDEDMEEAYSTTPQVTKKSPWASEPEDSAWPMSGGGSSAVSSLLSFQQRQRPRRHAKKKSRSAFGTKTAPSPVAASLLSKSPQSNAVSYGNMAKEISCLHARRESISWAANQLNITGSDSEDSPKPSLSMDDVLVPAVDPQSRVVRRAVTRRSNLLPKTKNFARIKAALAEEGAPVESDIRRESEVIRQVREDLDFESARQAPQPLPARALLSPGTPVPEPLETPDDAMMMDSNAYALRLSSSFKQHAQKNSKGRVFWETFSETSSVGGIRSTTPPPPPGPPRGCSSGMSLDDVIMDSPSLNSGPMGNSGFIFPPTRTTPSSGNDTPQPSGSSSIPATEQHAAPSVADVTRRLTKRRRDDDLDPVNFKRRAVSPGMSVQGSPIMQSPMQHAPWSSRPGANGNAGGVDKAGTPGSEGSTCGHVSDKARSKGRVGYQGMVDTNDGITRLSIE